MLLISRVAILNKKLFNLTTVVTVTIVASSKHNRNLDNLIIVENRCTPLIHRRVERYIKPTGMLEVFKATRTR